MEMQGRFDVFSAYPRLPDAVDAGAWPPWARDSSLASGAHPRSLFSGTWCLCDEQVACLRGYVWSASSAIVGAGRIVLGPLLFGFRERVRRLQPIHPPQIDRRLVDVDLGAQATFRGEGSSRSPKTFMASSLYAGSSIWRAM